MDWWLEKLHEVLGNLGDDGLEVFKTSVGFDSSSKSTVGSRDGDSNDDCSDNSSSSDREMRRDKYRQWDVTC